MKFIKTLFKDRFGFVDLAIIAVFASVLEHTGWVGLAYMIPVLVIGGLTIIHIQMKLGLK